MYAPKRFIAFLFLLSLVSAGSSFGQTQPKGTNPKKESQESTFIDPKITPAQQDKVATQSTWSFLSLEAVGAERFLKEHPEADGRGTIVLVFDTGVDPGIPGLLTTTEGKQKIIDVQDFSGSGDVHYQEAQRSGDELQIGGVTVLKGLSAHDIRPFGSTYYYGALYEKHFQNGLGDLNFNNEENDIFGMLIVEDNPNHFMVYLDENADGSIADSKPLFNFHERYDMFSFHSADSINTGGGRKLNGAVNIFPESNTVSVYFDDGSHGTHVAGIAAGHDIDGQKGFNGLAPGAEVIGIKFADNTIGGVTVTGSMKRAFEYAANLAKNGTKPVVVNVSFGIGSEIEAKSDMDLWLDSLLTAVPQLTVCVSAGNDGPGLSSIGLPGTASRVITSGAALPDDAGRDLYGFGQTQPILWDFSSRGGELAKPDIVTPGTAVSTVPDYVYGDRYNGTSMSSPYTTGCVAVLLSAMKHDFPAYRPNSHQVKRALQLSATHLNGLTPLDEGFGMINLRGAYELLAKWYRQGFVPSPYDIQVEVPNSSMTGTAAYFRNGIYPKNGENVTFTFKEVGKSYTNARERSIGMQAYDLVSDAPWLIPVESSTYRRGDNPINVHVKYNDQLLTKPGLYTGRVWGFPKTGSRSHNRSEAQFELLNTIIIPHRPSVANDYSISIPDIKPSNNSVHREFIAIPAGTKAVRIVLSGKTNAGAKFFNNDGREFGGLSLAKSATAKPSVITYTGADVTPGVWEIDITSGAAGNDNKDASVTLDVQTIPVELSTKYLQVTPQGYAKGEVQLTNYSTLELSTRADADILGYERVIDTLITSGDEFKLPFTQFGDEEAAEFSVELSREDYNKFTDISYMIRHNSDSVAVFNSAFDLREKTGRISFDDKKADSYTLVVKGGLALNDRKRPFRLVIRERRMLESSIRVLMQCANNSFYPDQTVDYQLESVQKLPPLPEGGYTFFGTIRANVLSDLTIKLPVEFSQTSSNSAVQ